MNRLVLDGDDPRTRSALRLAAREMLRELRRAKGYVPERFEAYRDDPVAFFREVLRVEPWDRQAQLIDAVGSHDRVLCRSGHKCGKSLSCVGLALWWVATRRQGRVILTAPTFRQVKDILWRELRFWYPRVQHTMGGDDLPKDPATGLHLPGGREITGVSTNQPENLAGISGAELLFIVDEASGFPDELYEVIKGNAAGGAKIVAISNPTRTVGWFYEGFKRGTYDLEAANVPASRWRLIHISSEETPNVLGGTDAIPGLATAGWVEEMREECSPDYESNAVYLVRVRGEFPTEATDSVIPLRVVHEAQKRWEDVPPEAAAPLVLGVDVARFGDDETVIQPVRGGYAWLPTTLSKADGPTVAEEVVRLALAMRSGERERVRINVDGIGVGSSVVDALRRHEACAEGDVFVVDVNVGESADDEDHSNLRSQLWFGLRTWLIEGGAIPDDDSLESELLAPTYTFDARGRKKVMSKEDIRKVIGRSPDRADALCLAVYRGRSTEYDYEPVRPTEEPAGFDHQEASGGRYEGW